MKRECLKISKGYSWKEHDNPLCCKFDNSGNLLLSAGLKGVVHVRNLKTGRFLVSRVAGERSEDPRVESHHLHEDIRRREEPQFRCGEHIGELYNILV